MNCDEMCFFCGAQGLVWVLFPPGPAYYACRSCSKMGLTKALGIIADRKEREVAAAPKEGG